MKKIVRLSEKERVFLVHAGVSADLSMKEIAHKTGMREHTVRYVRDSLLERGLIHPVYFVDGCRLGLIDLGLFFTRGSESSAARRRLEGKLQECLPVTWFAKLGGSFQYGVVLNLHKLDDIEPIYDLLRPTEVGAYFKKTVRIGLEWRTFSPNFLAPEIKQRQVVIHSARKPRISIDETDFKILQVLSKHPEKSFAEMARTMGMNANSFTYRVEKLTEKGAILGQGYWIAHEKVGVQLFRIMISDRGLSSEQKDDLFKFLSRYPAVGAIVTCTGSWDYEIRFETEEPTEVDDFSQQLYDQFGFGIDSISSVQQFQVLKRRAVPGL